MALTSKFKGLTLKSTLQGLGAVAGALTGEGTSQGAIAGENLANAITGFARDAKHASPVYKHKK